MTKPRRGRGPKRDWIALKADWLQSDETLNAFAQRHGIAHSKLYPRAAKGRWREEKLEIQNKALDKLKETKSVEIAAQWDKQIQLWSAVDGVAAQLLKEMHKLGVYDSQKLAQITASLHRSLIAQRLLAGQSTGKIDNAVPGDLHGLMVLMVQKMELDGRDTVGALEVHG